MVDIKEGYVYITTKSVSNDTISSGNYTVKIASTKIEDDFDNPITPIPITVIPNSQPIITGNYGATEAPKTIHINLLMIKRVITITGHLEDEQSESALTKKNNLIKLQNTGGSIKCVWGKYASGGTNQTRHSSVDQIEGTYTTDGVYGQILKMKITESPGTVSEDLGDSDFNVAGSEYATGLRKYDVIIQFLAGHNKYGG